jgi:drug/metabolite transporter (DMT)-like permease
MRTSDRICGLVPDLRRPTHPRKHRVAQGPRSRDFDRLGGRRTAAELNDSAAAPTLAARVPAALPRGATWFAGLGVVVLWASAFPAIRVAAPDLGVIGLSFARLALATAVLLVMAPVVKVRRPHARDVPLIVACGIFGMTAYELLLNWGELYVPAGAASMIIAAAPLVSVAIAIYLFHERLTPLRVAGSAVAILGVALVCLSRSGWSAGAAVWIVKAATVVQGIYHPLPNRC